MTANGTPKPGVRLPEEIEQSVLSQFYTTFRRDISDQAPNVPTWSTFASPMRVEEDILSHAELTKHETLNVLFENQSAVYSANAQEIKNFFSHREPWEDYDIYIFPKSMDWCIAFTHQQAFGIYVFVTGDVERFT